jgi:hypothetical protein
MPKKWAFDNPSCGLYCLVFSLLLLTRVSHIFSEQIAGEQAMSQLLSSLEIAAYWDKKIYERFPLTYNHLLSGGYFSTHSARMSEAGMMGFGLAHVPPYFHWNVHIQPFSPLELSANYRIFRHYPDPALGHQGFGDYADRGANVKYALITPEESLYRFPGVAVGIDDFMGTKKFTNYYLVGTQVFKEWGLEVSCGWGTGIYTKGPSRGFFGGANWFPLWQCQNRWIQGVGLTAEIDPTNYNNDPHPFHLHSHIPLNIGARYTFGDLVELSASYIRGDALAVAGSLHYNWGKTEGFLPKIQDPLPYSSPIDREPLGCYRPTDAMIQEMYYTFNDQGFQLTKAWLERSPEGTHILWLSLFNGCYRQEHVARMRLQHILAALTPSNIDEIVVNIESYGLPCQSYVYNRHLLLEYVYHRISAYEFDLLTPRQEACSPSPRQIPLIFQKKGDLWRCKIYPRFETFWGNARGKFKYDIGLKGSVDGFLPYGWYYEFQASYTIFSSLNHLADRDFFYPSQLPNVATDYVRYRQEASLTWDMLYTQKSWNCGRGLYTRIAGGYFQVNYGGIAAELLWYPAYSNIALGIEGALVKKRRYSGFGVQSTLRFFKGKTPVFRSYNTLEQYFLNLYLDFPSLCCFTKISVGQFLARDKGCRLEATRYFNNGVRLTGWVTLTNAFDIIHGKKYYDRGVALEIPFDFFFQRSSRRVWNYALAAWLRDAGYATSTGRTLFEVINRERRW